jgi:hypothetical protein
VLLVPQRWSIGAGDDGMDRRSHHGDDDAQRR